MLLRKDRCWISLFSQKGSNWFSNPCMYGRLLLPVLCIIEELSSVIESWFKVTKHVGFWLYNTTTLPWYRGLHIIERVTNDSKIPTSLFEKPRQRLPTILVKMADQWKSIPQSDFLYKDRSKGGTLKTPLLPAVPRPGCFNLWLLSGSSGSLPRPWAIGASCWGPGGMTRRDLSAPSELVPSAFPHCHLWTWSPWVNNSMPWG